MSDSSGPLRKWAIRAASGLTVVGLGIVVATVWPDSQLSTDMHLTASPSRAVSGSNAATIVDAPPMSELTTSTTSSLVIPLTSDDVCGFDNEVRYIESILQHHGIVNPHLRTDTHAPVYRRGEVTVEIRDCELKSAMAHEAGHYIMDLAHRFQLEAHLQDVITNFCPGGAVNGRCQNGWIQGDERFPGLEHAAHCIGNVLIGTTKYTKCPDEAMRATAAARIVQAAGVTH